MDPNTILVLIIGSILAVVLCALLLFRHVRVTPALVTRQAGPNVQLSVQAPPTISTRNIRIQAYTAAFGRELDQCRSVHEAVTSKLMAQRQQVLKNRKYSPKAPMVLPRLLQAMRSEDASGKLLVDIIQEDPGLTGDVLKLANTPYYRMTNEPVERVEYAIVVLGVDGLRALVTASIMQPIFRARASRFKEFTAVVWQQALDAAVSAQHYALRYDPDHAFSAHLATLIVHYADIIVFNYVEDLYQQAKSEAVLPGTFIRAFIEQRRYFARAIIKDWDLEALLMEPLNDFFTDVPVNKANVLSQAVYFGTLAGQLGVMLRKGCIQQTAMTELLASHGVPEAIMPGIMKPYQGEPGSL